jgi:hypothetical protein
MSGPPFLGLEETRKICGGVQGFPQLQLANPESVSPAHQSINGPIILLDKDSVPFRPFADKTPLAAVVKVNTTARVGCRVHSKAEWDTKRETITTLYWEEGKTLTKVMSIMAVQHNFHATQAAHQDPPT